MDRLSIAWVVMSVVIDTFGVGIVMLAFVTDGTQYGNPPVAASDGLEIVDVALVTGVAGVDFVSLALAASLGASCS